MTFDVMLLKQANNDCIARPALWPDSVVHGVTEQEALDRVCVLIRDLLSRTQLVQVEVDVPKSQVDNPWLARAGMFADDPTWDDFLKAMADHRRQLDNEQTSELA